MSQFRETPDEMIDYDFHKKDAARLRREARIRFMTFLTGTISFPFRQMTRFAQRWQAVWPAPTASNAGTRTFVSLSAGLAKARALLW